MTKRLNHHHHGFILFYIFFHYGLASTTRSLSMLFIVSFAHYFLFFFGLAFYSFPNFALGV